MYSRQIKEKTESLNHLITRLLHVQTEAQKLQQVKAENELKQANMDKKRKVLIHALTLLERPPVADNFLIDTPHLKKEVSLQLMLEYSSKPANTQNFNLMRPNLANSILHSRWEARIPKPTIQPQNEYVGYDQEIMFFNNFNSA